MGNKYPKPKSLTMAQQRSSMSANFPGFRFGGNDGKASWVGLIKPTDQSENYLVKIEYRLGYRPKIIILSPKIQKRDDQSKIPHIYSGDFPCVYYPKTGEWHSGKFISTYIVPWVHLWLYFYEVWLATGDWYGEGIDHGEEAKE